MQRPIVPFLLLAMLVGCGTAKLEGPLTQEILDDVQHRCGLNSARIESAEPEQPVEIKIEGFNMEGPEVDVVMGLQNSKCLKEKLTEMGVDYEVTVVMEAPELETQFNRAMKEAQ
jgi:hypothetical protein